MKVFNHTPHATRLLSLERDDSGRVQAVLVLKATWEPTADGALAPAAEPVPIIADRLDTPFGVFHTDHFVRREGVDLCVLATVRRAAPVREVVARVQVGAFSHALRVIGDRRWVRVGDTLVPSAPEAFTEMPIAYARAYGGRTVVDYEDMVFAENPDGVGYYGSEALAEGAPLPNIEPLDGPPRARWSDPVPVAGWGPYPMFWALRALEGVTPRGTPEEPELPQLQQRLNNNAHPSLVLPAFAPGDAVRIEGVEDGARVFVVPREAPFVEAHIGERSVQSVGELDAVTLWYDSGRVTATYRAHFAYTFTPEELRRLHVVMSPTA